MEENVKTDTIDESPRYNVDRWLLGIYFILVIISLIESYSASSQQVSLNNIYSPLIKHGLLLVAGFGLMALMASINYPWYRIIIPVIAVLTIVMLCLVPVIGVYINGARRAISILGFTLQPSEFAKFSTVGLAALIVSRCQLRQDVSVKGLVFSTLVVAIGSGMLYRQGATNTAILMLSGLSVILIGGVKFKKFIIIGIIYLLLFLSYNKICDSNEERAAEMAKIEAEGGEIEEATDEGWTLDNIGEAAKGKNDNKSIKELEVDRSETRTSRISNWKHNILYLIDDPITKDNRQEMIAHYAQAHGGIYGVGIGQSRECSRLPLAFTDYIYSIIVEETGFIGAILVLMLYLWLLVRAGRIASKCSRAFPALLIIGMAVMIVYQALIHMAINTGLFPVSGQPLPLISVGGTSILVTSMAFGVMLSISRSAAKGKEAIAKENESLPNSLDAVNPSQID